VLTFPEKDDADMVPQGHSDGLCAADHTSGSGARSRQEGWQFELAATAGGNPQLFASVAVIIAFATFVAKRFRGVGSGMHPGLDERQRMTDQLEVDSVAPPSAATQRPLALLTQVFKTYQMDSVEVPVIRGVDILVRHSKFTVLLGPSGSGKTTLLNMLGCVDKPDKGEIVVADEKVAEMSDDALSDFRARNIGFIFQNFNLLPVLSAYENIEYPLLLAGATPSQRGKLVPRLLKAVGLSDRAKNLPGQMSGGQRQRVAIARALARKPKLVIADEPTANLDSHTGATILALMRRMVDEYAISFIFSSHDPEVIKAADDTIVLKDGLIQEVWRDGEKAG